MTTSQILPPGSSGVLAHMHSTTSTEVSEPERCAVNGHAVQFYEDDAYLLDSVAEYVGTGFHAGASGVVILTGEHREGLNDRLTSQGFDLAELQAAGRYVSADAESVLPLLMDGDDPDPKQFLDIVGAMVAEAARDARPVRVFGELVALLAMDDNHAAAVRLEQFWNQLQETVPFSLLCAYPLGAFAGHDAEGPMRHVCEEHSAVTAAESFSALISDDDRSRAIAELQRKAARLEVEIARREEAEASLRIALEAEQAARREAETALGVRDEFLSIAAHDLKTPVTVLSGHAQLMLRQVQRDKRVDPEHVLEAVDEIAEQASNLAELINQLLDTSRLESGFMPIERRRVDLAAITRSVVASRQTTTGSHTLSLSAPKRLAATLDPLRIKQVINNLLDNAIKYSPDGHKVDITLSRSPDSGIVLSVRDHGVGISLEARDHIFERFYQAHGVRHRSGLGLGLFITREIVELHGGSIHAEFPPDGGSCFVVNLPVFSADPALAIVS